MDIKQDLIRQTINHQLSQIHQIQKANDILLEKLEKKIREEKELNKKAVRNGY